MFNNHFFECKESYMDFIRRSTKILLIIDPPYGGLVSLISNTIDTIKNGIRLIYT
jgi:hypothetical protein